MFRPLCLKQLPNLFLNPKVDDWFYIFDFNGLIIELSFSKILYFLQRFYFVHQYLVWENYS